MTRYLEALVDRGNAIPLAIGVTLVAVVLAVFSSAAPTPFWLDVAILTGAILLAPHWIQVLRNWRTRVLNHGTPSAAFRSTSATRRANTRAE